MDELILYKNKFAVVVSPEDGDLKTIPDCNKNVEKSNTKCPMCGQFVDPMQFSFEGQAYFSLLQKKFRRWKLNIPTNHMRTKECIIDSSNSIRLAKLEMENASQQGENVPSHIPSEFLITGYYDRFFVEHCHVGSGSFGHVYQCSHILDGHFLGEYAVKKVPVGDDRDWLKRMLKEVKVRERFRHVNIVDYNHSWLEMHRLNDFNPLVPWLFVLMEFCNGGDLESLVSKVYRDSYLDESEIWFLFRNILIGLEYLHTSAIIYRDLKPENILLKVTENATNPCHALLSDFQTAEVLDTKDGHNRQGYTGTIEYTAPELLVTNTSGKFVGEYNVKSDMWSLGMTLYYISYGFLPYTNPDPKVCRSQILKHSELALPNLYNRSKLLQFMIISLTSYSPDSRPDCGDIMENPLIRKLLNHPDTQVTGSKKLASRLSDRV
ncbi:Protein kinase domain [Babesia microti strain RI]|uniref:Protein kinase domain n=1 Tax=Babesia microti (strain RI) TaxID=1133968 RepID=A0A1N6LYB4_BABMR|nr:Protein kinase domain [Babesia microti strain RI]SIO73852.1 Protein kinase domain [Babesia microti strain RI]|eukprot:XP_021337905.1 Protein kinase domain [Babesia microti strain RI]